MKNYNKILEAINRGIQLALDDFDDDQVQHVKAKQVQNRDYTKEYLNLLKYEAINLELPSGTLWCKYNLDVKPNQLSKPEDWYGGYYAWGELEANKPIYDWEHYKFSQTKFTSEITKKYNKNDNLTELLSEDDPAYQNKKFYNFKFHIPTKEQCEELINYTTNYWVNNYDPNKIIHNSEDDKGIQGLNGRVFIGKNGNQLFIPAAGYYGGSCIYNVGSLCFSWSSSLYTVIRYSAWSFSFESNEIYTDVYARCHGYTIRPVVNI